MRRRMVHVMARRNDAVMNLLAALPARDADEIEQQARAILRILFEPIADDNLTPGQSVPENPATCPNCDTPSSLTRSPYCSTDCREIAGFVRQIRAGLADGTILEPERQVAFGQNLWQLLGGGLPLRVHLVPQ